MQRTASMVLAAIAAQPVAVAAFLQPAKWRTLQAAIGPLGSRSCTSCAKVRVGADQRFSSASSASGFREYEGHFGEVLHDSRTRRSSISSPLTLLASQFSPRKQNCCAPYRTRECQMCASHYLEEGCVVEYRLQDADAAADETADEAGVPLGLGVYTKQNIGGSAYIQPLCTWSEEVGVSQLLWDEDSQPVPIERVHRVLDPDLVYVSERQMGGGMGMGNPHGEHGEDCYDLSDVPLSDGVRLVVRSDREVWW